MFGQVFWVGFSLFLIVSAIGGLIEIKKEGAKK